jgi:hypothetical protein
VKICGRPRKTRPRPRVASGNPYANAYTENTHGTGEARRGVARRGGTRGGEGARYSFTVRVTPAENRGHFPSAVPRVSRIARASRVFRVARSNGNLIIGLAGSLDGERKKKKEGELRRRLGVHPRTGCARREARS